MDNVDAVSVLRRLHPNEFLKGGAVVWMYLPILPRPASGCPHLRVKEGTDGPEQVACGSHQLRASRWQQECMASGGKTPLTVSSLVPFRTFEGQPATHSLCRQCGMECAITKDLATVMPTELVAATADRSRSFVSRSSLDAFSLLEDASLTALSALAFERALADAAPWASTMGYASLRDLLMRYRVLHTAVLPVVGAAKHPCITCGDACWNYTSDGCCKVSSLSTVPGSRFDVSAAGGVVLPTNAMAVVEKTAEVTVRPPRDAKDDERGCGNGSGPKFDAARSVDVRGKRTAQVAHLQLGACPHEHVQMSWLSLRNETFAAHAVQALLALAVGATHHGLDVYCQVAQSWTAQNRADGAFLTPVARLLCADIEKVVVVAPSVADGPGAPTTFTIEMGSPAAQAGADVNLAKTALQRVSAGLGARVRCCACGKMTVYGFIPAVHAYGHTCSCSFGARAVVGAANGDEHAEQVFAWFSHRFVRMKNMSPTTMALFLEYSFATYNTRMNMDAPTRLLAAFIRVLKKFYYQTRPAVQTQRAALGAAGAVDVLTCEATTSLLRARVLRDWAAAKKKNDDRTGPAVRQLHVQSQISALRSALPGSIPAPGAAPLLHDGLMLDVLFASLCDPAVNPTAATAMSGRAKTVAAGNKRLAELEKEQSGLPRTALTPADVLKQSMDALHRLSSTMAALRAELAKKNNNGLKSTTISARMAAVYSEARRLRMIIVGVQSSVPAIPPRPQLKAWTVPEDLLADRALPSQLDDLHFGEPRDRYDAVLDAICEHARTCEALANAIAEVGKTAEHVRQILRRLHGQLAALHAPEVDLQLASGGVFSPVAEAAVTGDAVKDPVPLFQLPSTFPPRHAAPGLAFGIASDIRRLEAILQQLINLQCGIALLPVAGDDTPLPARARDAHGVRLLLQYGGPQLLRGTWTAEEWSATYSGRVQKRAARTHGGGEDGEAEVPMGEGEEAEEEADNEGSVGAADDEDAAELDRAAELAAVEAIERGEHGEDVGPAEDEEEPKGHAA